MSSLLPLIVLSIALLHCTQAVLKCKKSDITYQHTNAESDAVESRTDPPCNGRCFVKLSRKDWPDKSYRVIFGCARSAAVESDFKQDHLTFTSIEEDENYARFLCEKDKKFDLSELFDSTGDKAQKFRATQAKSIGLKVGRDTTTGKVEFKWNEGYSVTNCMEWKYVQDVNGDRIEEPVKLTVPKRCESPGACYLKVTRIEGSEKKIEMDAGCAAPDPAQPVGAECSCQTILEELTSRCVCPAKKIPLNRRIALFDPTPNANDKKKKRNGFLKKIGILFEYQPNADNAVEGGTGQFKYDENYGTIAPEEPVTVSGETTVPLPPTARPPSQLPEDDPYYEELLGSATGLSLTFAMLLPILRLI